jgi:transposase InsO family protein
MYCGGAIFVDQASGYLFIQSQVTFSSTETLEAKLTFERMALGCGVTIVSYVTDNGAFSAKEFSDNIAQRGQQAKYSGVGAHHHNGIAERAIQTTSNMARTMTLLFAHLPWSMRPISTIMCLIWNLEWHLLIPLLVQLRLVNVFEICMFGVVQSMYLNPNYRMERRSLDGFPDLAVESSWDCLLFMHLQFPWFLTQ